MQREEEEEEEEGGGGDDGWMQIVCPIHYLLYEPLDLNRSGSP